MIKKDFKKALFVLHYSPPIHGASMVGDTIVNSNVIGDRFKSRFIKIKSSNNLEEIGLFKLNKIWFIVELFFTVFYQLIIFRPHLIYYTASPNGLAFYRDLIITLPVKFFCFCFKRKLVFHYHAKGIYSFSSKNQLSKVLTNFFLLKAHIILISKQMKIELRGIKGYKSINFLNNGVKDHLDKRSFTDVNLSRHKSDKIQVLYLSNMMKEKGYDIVLDLAKYAKETDLKGIKFHFAGGWATIEDQNYFDTFVSKYNLDDLVLYHGLVRGEEKKLLFEQANLFIFPSVYAKEVFPLSILEALSYGLPIIAFNAGAVSEIISEEIGLLTSKENLIESFNIIKEKYLNEAVSRKCRSVYLEKYSLEKFEKSLLELLEI
ncbi:glycosyltransferase family 4 protein [Algibacter mikhailovii]|uniref:Glycosyl transferase n=1 Tax=Algibacter mikhailovii TaxID=425498 RepID=A0A918R8K7_9FLAO|nr:glycosyltransferase family 4 protein [Algibacter mikhailovii]GGZ89246.1 glycosyl transferase [Algibacter mikhailovii]